MWKPNINFAKWGLTRDQMIKLRFQKESISVSSLVLQVGQHEASDHNFSAALIDVSETNSAK